MDNFSYYNPTRLVLGKDVENEAGSYVGQFGKKALLHYGGGSIKKNGIYDRVTASLKKSGVAFVELGGVQPNPRLGLVREGIALCREENVDFVLAVGGGSAIDSAKAIAAGVVSDSDVWEYFADRTKAAQTALPLGVVLTIPASGSESSPNMVITNEDGWLKRGAEGEGIIPKFALINPETNYTLPPYQTACGCSDILAHLMERYFTNTPDVDFTDRMLEAAMRTILYNAPQALAEPENYSVRAEINFAGSVAHNGLLGSGRVEDWASHNIEHELSAIYDVAHGAGLAVVFPAWMKYVWKQDPGRFVQWALRVMDVDLAFAKQEQIILTGIQRLENFYRAIGMPVRLGELGIGEDRLREMADKAASDGSTVGQFVKLGADDILGVLRLAL